MADTCSSSVRIYLKWPHILNEGLVMKKENMDDLIMHRGKDENGHAQAPPEKTISDELEKAIQLLIYRLRELGPI